MIRFPVAALTISVCFVVLLFSEAEASELKPCPSGKYFTWHMCFGTHTFVNGDKYVGEWKHGKMDGDGTLLEPDGGISVGVWKDNKLIKEKQTKKQTKKQPTSPEDKLEELKRLAKQGDADAQFKLGSMYEKGEGVRQSDRSAKYWYKRAVKQYTRAAEQGNADAQLKLAVMYEVGMGVPKNYETSAKWYTHRAAEQGNADAQVELGVMYEDGIGVPKDYKAAVKWYTRAAEQGNADAKILVDNAREKLEEQERIHKEKREEQEQIAEELRIAEEKRKQERQCKGDDESKWQNCEGTLTSHSGKVYVGIFKDGIFDGKNAEKGSRYVGEYKNGTWHGQGTLTYADGGKYVGEWRNGKRNGQGTRTWSDGDKYVGEWRDGKNHGQGTYTFADGGKYVGEYRNGERNGQGTRTWSDGVKYVGEWRDHKFHGQGTYTYASGDKYVGEFRDGKNHGQGTYFHSNGDVWRGTFAKGEWVSGDKYPALLVPPKLVYGSQESDEESQRFEEANDNIRMALDILNYTLKGDKHSREGAIASSSQECTFHVFNAFGKQTLYVDNIVSDTVQFYSKKIYNEAWQQWQERYYVEFGGDERVWNDSSSSKIFLHTDADLERAQKAWGLLFSKACEGASPSEF